jgi:voltage-gated potassium channel Kch
LPAGALSSPTRNLVVGLIYLLTVMTVASISYVAAGWTLGDAIYMVVLTVFTVGYGEVEPVNTVLLRVITIGDIVLGCTGVIFLTGALVQFITAAQINQILGSKRMNEEIDRLTGHVIVCGFGRIGMQLAQDLQAGGTRFVIIEREEPRVQQARTLGYLCISGDATEEETLRSGGIDRARTLATVLPNDAANVFITLSARSLNPKLDIIARGEAPATERKLLHAGANQVILPAHIGAERIAELILYRDSTRLLRGSAQIVDFERTLRTLGLKLDVVTAAAGSRAAGMTIAWIEQQGRGDFFVVQLDRAGGETITRPDPALRVAAGDGVTLIGRVLGAQPLFAAPT